MSADAQKYDVRELARAYDEIKPPFSAAAYSVFTAAQGKIVSAIAANNAAAAANLFIFPYSVTA